MPENKRPIQAVVINCNMFQSRKGQRRAVKWASIYGAIVVVNEAKWIGDPAEFMDTDKWEIVRYTGSNAEKNTFLMFRKDRVKVLDTALHHGVNAPGLLPRYIVQADIEIDGREDYRKSIFGGHAPPKRVWRPYWNRYMAAHRDVTADADYPVISGADWNKRKAPVKDASGLNFHGWRIDGFAHSPGQGITYRLRKDVGSDHPAMVIRIRN